MEDNRNDPAREVWFKFLMELTPDATVIVDSEGKIVVVNDKALELFGYARDELLDNSIEILVPEEKRAAHIGFRNAFLANSSVKICENLSS